MNTQISTILLIFCSVLYADTYEDSVPKDLVELQRKYSGRAIYEMIKYVLNDDNECKVKFKHRNSRSSFTFVVDSKHMFNFSNRVNYGDMQLSSIYDCLISKDKKRLECERVLPNEEMNQSWSDYIRMTMNLDEKGNIVSMHGNKTREHRKLGFSHPWFNQVLANFKCDIAHPSKVDKPEVKDEEKRQGKTGIDGKKEPDIVDSTQKPEKTKNR